MARPSKAKAIERLRRALDKVPELEKLSSDSPEFEKWRRDTRVAIENTFVEDSTHVQEFDGISFYWRPVLWTGENETYKRKTYLRGLQKSFSLLESMIEEIEEYWEEENGGQTSSYFPHQEDDTLISNKVFIVHGHDESVRETVARFLEKLQIDPIILHEQPNQGRTIIEKFEDYTDVVFAVVLLTPDDLGTPKDRRDDLEFRARQNVVFELGFFIGKLGRSKVCTLVKGTVETPSDYDGVVYTELDDAGGWKTKLVQELKAAGFNIDADRAFGSA